MKRIILLLPIVAAASCSGAVNVAKSHEHRRRRSLAHERKADDHYLQGATMLGAFSEYDWSETETEKAGDRRELHSSSSGKSGKSKGSKSHHHHDDDKDDSSPINITVILPVPPAPATHPPATTNPAITQPTTNPVITQPTTNQTTTPSGTGTSSPLAGMPAVTTAPSLSSTMTTTSPQSISPSMSPTTAAPTTLAPTELPSVSPSTAPSSAITDVPSMIPSTHPSNYPSDEPTDMPSDLPSSMPSIMVSKTPTFMPTVAPTEIELPTITPTDIDEKPTKSPSPTIMNETSEPTRVVDQRLDAQMSLFGKFDNDAILSKKQKKHYQLQTANYIEDFYNNVNDSKGLLDAIKSEIKDVRVQLKIIDQEFDDETKRVKVKTGKSDTTLDMKDLIRAYTIDIEEDEEENYLPEFAIPNNNDNRKLGHNYNRLLKKTDVTEPCKASSSASPPLTLTFIIEISYERVGPVPDDDLVISFPFSAVPFRENYINDYLKKPIAMGGEVADVFKGLTCTSRIGLSTTSSPTTTTSPTTDEMPSSAPSSSGSSDISLIPSSTPTATNSAGVTKAPTAPPVTGTLPPATNAPTSLGSSAGTTLPPVAGSLAPGTTAPTTPATTAGTTGPPVAGTVVPETTEPPTNAGTTPATAAGTTAPPVVGTLVPGSLSPSTPPPVTGTAPPTGSGTGGSLVTAPPTGSGSLVTSGGTPPPIPGRTQPPGTTPPVTGGVTSAPVPLVDDIFDADAEVRMIDPEGYDHLDSDMIERQCSDDILAAVLSEADEEFEVSFVYGLETSTDDASFIIDNMETLILDYVATSVLRCSEAVQSRSREGRELRGVGVVRVRYPEDGLRTSISECDPVLPLAKECAILTNKLLVTSVGVSIPEVHREILTLLSDAFQESIFVEFIPELVTTSYLGPDPEALIIDAGSALKAENATSKALVVVFSIGLALCILKILFCIAFPKGPTIVVEHVKRTYDEVRNGKRKTSKPDIIEHSDKECDIKPRRASLSAHNLLKRVKDTSQNRFDRHRMRLSPQAKFVSDNNENENVDCLIDNEQREKSASEISYVGTIRDNLETPDGSILDDGEYNAP